MNKLLEGIAYQCPKEGGNAVYRARALLKTIGAYSFIDNDDCEEQSQLQSLSTNSSINLEADELYEKKALSKNESWSIYPNPTNGQFYLQGDSLDNVKMLQLYSLTGKLVQEWNKDQIRSSKLNLSDNLSDGVYFIRFMQVDGSSFSSKLIISK